jgi:23S rRNA pseudouridine2605 synthase
VRLDKRIADRTGWSRRDVGFRIRKGRVTVGGEVVRDPARPVGDDERIEVDGEPLPSPPPRLALFHKPVGVHSSVTDPYGRACLGTAAAELVDLGLHPVGRLDADTDGLLLFSSDGPLTQWLLHPRRAIERVYVARVEGRPGPELVERLAAGVQTAEGTFTGAVRAIDGDRVTVAVTEGKHRMVRRMLANAGFPVLELRRIAYGPFSLGDLPAGAWRLPTEDELAGL